jgi:activator of Hsp90 ATPase-like protein
MIVQSVLLPLAPSAAFELFTDKISLWWPADRRHTDDPASTIVLRADGSFYERARNGREVVLGHVRTWDFPNRIVLDFFIATGPERPTEVEVTFVAEAGGTRVTVRHGPQPASEALWPERAPRYARSWESVLAALGTAAG